jgi:hypothetical protein
MAAGLQSTAAPALFKERAVEFCCVNTGAEEEVMLQLHKIRECLRGTLRQTYRARTQPSGPAVRSSTSAIPTKVLLAFSAHTNKQHGIILQAPMEHISRADCCLLGRNNVPRFTVQMEAV